MKTLNQYMDEYKQQMEKGMIPKAYHGLMEYILSLRTHFKTKYPEFYVSGGIYFGYMDMTYFAIVPESLKHRNLKIAIVFIHETCRFEAWLAGSNKQVQKRYWDFFKRSGWNQYRLVPSIAGADSILEHSLADTPNFDHLDALTDQIERETMKLIADVETFLTRHGME
ncbi:MAG TPA: hypothetical protein PKJ34_12390 [Anaerolineaceae bacterium]|nr:hypothetical protein [Longilinea sp.]HNZ02006.1 hypothetical protein [Anaerolineaceae bacterium]